MQTVQTLSASCRHRLFTGISMQNTKKMSPINLQLDMDSSIRVNNKGELIRVGAYAGQK